MRNFHSNVNFHHCVRVDVDSRKDVASALALVAETVQVDIDRVAELCSALDFDSEYFLPELSPSENDVLRGTYAWCNDRKTIMARAKDPVRVVTCLNTGRICVLIDSILTM